MQDKVKKDTKHEEEFSCKKCNYKCWKEVTLNKHIVANHDNYQCKKCLKELPTFMELLKHVAKHHQNYLSDSNEENKSVDPVEKDVGIDKKEGKKSICTWQGCHDRRERPLTGCYLLM